MALSGSRIFWDPTGLAEGSGGIAVHGKLLYESLALLGIRPRILDLPDSTMNPFRKVKFLAPSMHDFGQLSASPFIFHGLANVNIPHFACPKHGKLVITVHDPIPLLEPIAKAPISWLQFRIGLPLALRDAAAVVCVSFWTRDWIAEQFPEYLEKITVIPNGADAFTDCVKGNENTRIDPENQALNLLYISRFEHYKNFNLLARLSESFPNINLTVVTGPGRDLKRVQACFDRVKSKKIRVLTKVPRPELAELFKVADVYIHPSYYEGYCLPAVEALSVGCPVVYLGGSGIDEVVPKALGVRLERHSSDNQWYEACLSQKYHRMTPQFQVDWRTYLATRPTWANAATKLKNLYNELLT